MLFVLQCWTWNQGRCCTCPLSETFAPTGRANQRIFGEPGHLGRAVWVNHWMHQISQQLHWPPRCFQSHPKLPQLLSSDARCIGNPCKNVTGSITLRNTSRCNYLCMISIANMPFPSTATSTQMKSQWTGTHPLWKPFKAAGFRYILGIYYFTMIQLSHCMLYCIPQRTNKYCYYFKIILIYCFSFHTWSVAFLQHFKYHVPLKDPLHHAKFNFLHFQPESKSNEHSHSVQSKWMSYNLIQILLSNISLMQCLVS